MPNQPFVTARWLDLVMANYEVDPAVLDLHVPPGTVLDTYEGKHLASMVGFRFVETSVLGIRVPFHSVFEEVNLRFYVRREVDGEVRRGVVFIKEIVPRRAVTWVANTLYNEHYVTLPMDHAVPAEGEDGRVSYSWQFAGQRCVVGAERSGPSEALQVGSEREFIAEHYYGYAAQPSGHSIEYRVEHPPWRVWNGLKPELEFDARGLYGGELSPFLEAKPSSVIIAQGSTVGVFRGRRL